MLKSQVLQLLFSCTEYIDLGRKGNISPFLRVGGKSGAPRPKGHPFPEVGGKSGAPGPPSSWGWVEKVALQDPPSSWGWVEKVALQDLLWTSISRRWVEKVALRWPMVQLTLDVPSDVRAGTWATRCLQANVPWPGSCIVPAEIDIFCAGKQ